jgi:hypothetical protein
MLTLAEYKAQMIDNVNRGVIDEFIKSDYVLQNIPFDSNAYPSAGGNAWTYAYNRVTTQPTAATRALGNEFVAQDAKTTRYSIDLKILGGSHEFDRVMASTGYIADQVTMQLQQKTKAVRSLFHDLFINGNTGSDANAFDGLSVALTGSTTEYNADTVGEVDTEIDLSSSTNVDNNYKTFLDKLDDFLSLLDGRPSVLLMNRAMKVKMMQVARRALAYTEERNEFGVPVSFYNGIPFVDLGEKPGSTTDIIGTVSRGSPATTGLTDIYAVRFGVDGVHAVSPSSTSAFLNTYLPNMSLPGAVKKLEVEMVTTVVLKATKAAGVFRNLKVV